MRHRRDWGDRLHPRLGVSTRALATAAVRNAITDAGLKPPEVDGMLSYHWKFGDSTFCTFVAGDLGIRLNFYMDVQGGGSSTEALVGIATGLIEAGMSRGERLFAGAVCESAWSPDADRRR
jgi:3-oxoacyl-[acyl-carrier-protein] synthase III